MSTIVCNLEAVNELIQNRSVVFQTSRDPRKREVVHKKWQQNRISAMMSMNGSAGSKSWITNSYSTLYEGTATRKSKRYVNGI